MNEEGIKVLGVETAYQFRMMDTISQKRTNHLNTQSSGGNEAQIYYIMAMKQHARQTQNGTGGRNAYKQSKKRT